MDAKGLWGPWSKTFSFTARGAAYPLDVKVVWDETKGVGTLSGKANPVGCRPTKYRVYGSDEKGFTVMDKPRQLDLGISAKNEMAAWNPWARTPSGKRSPACLTIRYWPALADMSVRAPGL
jgi:hypothetical protein